MLGYGLYHTADLVGWGKWALAVLAVLAAGLAGVALAVAGTVWTGPLTWLVWGHDVAGAALVVVLLLVAAGGGTPGCEIGVVRELVRRRRGEPDDRPVYSTNSAGDGERRRPIQDRDGAGGQRARLRDLWQAQERTGVAVSGVLVQPEAIADEQHHHPVANRELPPAWR